MAVDGHLVADSDMHIFEPPDLWQRYIDPAWRHAAPVGLSEMRRDMRVKVKSHVLLRSADRAPTVRPQRVEGGDGGTVQRGRATGLEPGHRRRMRWTPRASTSAVLFPTPRPLRARARRAGAGGTRRARAGASPPRSRAPTTTGWHDFCRAHPDALLRRRDGRAARRRPGAVARGAALRGGARLQGGLPVAGRGEPPPVAPSRLRSRCGRSASASASPSASTAADRTTCARTSPSRSSTS